MLTPQQLEELPAAVVRLWQQVEDDILKDAARRIGKMGRITDTADWQLWRYEQTKLIGTDVINTLARYSGKSVTEIRKAFTDATTLALATDDKIYRRAGLDPPPINEDPALQNLLDAGYLQTYGSWQNLTQTTANTVSGQFEDVLSRAALQVETGAFDYRTAIKWAVDLLAGGEKGDPQIPEGGMRYITYPSGHTDTLEVAVRRAVMTGVNQTAGKLQVARMDEMGCDFVETTAHGGARPEHAKWQGRFFHRGGAVVLDGVRYEDFVTATGYGTGPGLCGWNCSHQFGPFFPGVTEPIWSGRELERLNAKQIEYQGQKYTRYDISQMQRAAEREVRKYKRRFLAEEAAGLDTTQTAVQLRTARKKLAAFISETGGQPDSSRTSVAGFGRSAASKATWKAKSAFQSVRGAGGEKAPSGEMENT